MNEEANSDSEQSEIVCRFCLDGAKTGANPLLDPCVCRGSIQYVHLVCLNRWRLQGTGDNRDTCPICHTFYRFDFEDTTETIPRGTFLFCIIEYPLLTSCMLHYVWTVTSLFHTQTKVGSGISYEYFQCVYHCVQLAQLLSRWKVKKWGRYLIQWRLDNRCCLPLLHVCVFAAGLFGASHFSYVISNLLLPLYWMYHVEIIHEINDRLLDHEN